MTTITIERAILDRLVDAWDSTVLPKSHDGMMQERMEDLRAALAAPATAPAWHDAPTCAGLWLCDEGDENPYRFTCHDISMPLNPHLVGEGERWYGPIPKDKS